MQGVYRLDGTFVTDVDTTQKGTTFRVITQLKKQLDTEGGRGFVILAKDSSNLGNQVLFDSKVADLVWFLITDKNTFQVMKFAKLSHMRYSAGEAQYVRLRVITPDVAIEMINDLQNRRVSA